MSVSNMVGNPHSVDLCLRKCKDMVLEDVTELSDVISPCTASVLMSLL